MAKLTRAGHMPLYHQLKELLTEKIGSGEWAPGRRLPTELELAGEYGVSRVTVRQALQLLQNSGMVERVQGRGTFVGRPKIAHNLLGVFHSGVDIVKTGGKPRLQLHHMRRVPAPASVAIPLAIAPRDDVFELRRSGLADDEPLLLFTSWFPAALFPGFLDKGWERRSIWDALHDYGIYDAVQHKEVEITILDAEEAGLLETAPGTPALLVTYLTSTTDGTPFEYRRMVLRGDRCKYFLDLDRAEQLV